MDLRIQRRLQQWRNYMDSWACHPLMLHMKMRLTTSSAHTSNKCHVDFLISCFSHSWEGYIKEKVK